MIDTSAAFSAVSQKEAKAFLRVDHDFEDSLIEALCVSCTQMAEHELQRVLISREGAEGYGSSPADVPAGIRQWILLHVSYFYENRAAASAQNTTAIARLASLLDPFRTWQ